MNFTFRDGDRALSPLPGHLIAQIQLNCQRFGTSAPSCVRRNQYAPLVLSGTSANTTGYRFRDQGGSDTPFVVPGTTDRCLSACFVDLRNQIVVVQHADVNNGEAAIVIPSKNLKSGTRTLYHIWDPSLPENAYDKNSASVEKIAKVCDKQVVDSGKPTAKRTRKSVLDEDSDEDDYVPAKKKPAAKVLKKTNKSSESDATISDPTTSSRQSFGGVPLTVSGVRPDSVQSHQTSKPSLKLRFSNPAMNSSRAASSNITSSRDDSITNLPDDLVSTPNILQRPHVRQPLPQPQNLQITQTPQPSDERITNFIFRTSHEDTNNRHIPASRITTNDKLFSYALCTGLITPSLDVLQVTFGGEVTYVMRQDDIFFRDLTEKIQNAAGQLGDVILDRVQWG